MKYFVRVIALLCVLCGALSCHKPASPPARSTIPLPAPPAAFLFREVAQSVGFRFQHFSGATKQKYFPEIMGSGVALLDYNGDGVLDIFVVQGDLINPQTAPGDLLFPRPPASTMGCRLFRNDLARTGKLHFTDVTEQAGLAHLNLGYGMGVAVGDYDNDGYPDLYVTGYGRSVLLHNNGRGGFTDVTRQAGVSNAGNWGASAAFVDYDQDGKLDLVVANYVDFTVGGNQKCVSVSGLPDYCGPTSYKGVSARLYHNLGGGRFADVTRASGLGAIRAAGLGVSCADLDGDGWPDLFLANDQDANTLWLNQRNSTFKEAALPAGCAGYNPIGRPQANMGLAVGDVDNKGSEDVLITHLITEGATLFRNDGHANFADATVEAGLREVTFPATGFGADWFDYDNDGRLDLFITNGAVARQDKVGNAMQAKASKTEDVEGGKHAQMEGSSGQPTNEPKWPFAQAGQLFHNEGAGRRFSDTTPLAAPASDLWGAGRGAAFGDLNNDGRVDVVITNNNGPARLLLNQTPTRNHWLEVRLQGVQSNRMGLGARVGVFRKSGETLWRRCHTDGSYCSASDARVHFGLGTSPDINKIVVQWSPKFSETWNNLAARIRVDKIITLREGTGQKR